MTTRKKAEQIGDAILRPYREELDAKKNDRQTLRSIQERRRESPLVPAFIAATTTYVVLDFTDSALFAVMLGAAVGGLFGWAARRSNTGRG